MKIEVQANRQKQNSERQTPWKSVSLCFLIQILNGIQFSIYFTSLWPYLTTLEPKAKMSFFGWIMAIFSIGQMCSSWIFGFWNQKTMSTRQPAICGLMFSAVGNVIYGLLPLLPSHRDWCMLFARFLTGFGSGTMSVIRSYCAMASARKDLPKVMPLVVGSFVLGICLGPSIQSIFVPIGKEGFYAGFIKINVYTAPAFAMVLVSLLSTSLLLFVFGEDYSGVISKDVKSNPYFVLPKFDRIAAVVCIYMYFLQQMCSTSVEVMSSPLTISMYNWTNKKALLYNGTLQTIACGIDIISYFLISFTKFQKVDKRYLLLISLSLFIVYQLFLLPWPFYNGPLQYIKLAPNSTHEDTEYSGGCYRRYRWCATSRRVPLPIYVLGSTTVLSLAFPFLAASVGILYSQILGPRKQGVMQGINEFFGCFARCVTPVIQSALFEHFGYLPTYLMNLVLLSIGLLSLVVFYGRMKPLRMKPKIGVATAYKRGVFYRF